MQPQLRVSADQLGSAGFMINAQLKKQLVDLSTNQELDGKSELTFKLVSSSKGALHKRSFWL